jgi:hypothetical protein
VGANTAAGDDDLERQRHHHLQRPELQRSRQDQRAAALLAR